MKAIDGEAAELTCMSGYPEDIPLTDWKEYDISVHCPDIVYIQNPYDGENPCLTVPSVFYAKNMLRYTKKLVYIPFSKTAEFTAEDKNDIYNMKHYVTAPGVVYADEVLVQSQNMKEQYVEVLTDFAGPETRAIWENKIIVAEPSGDDKEGRTEKKVLFCIGANELSEKGEKFVLHLREKLKIFYDAMDSIHLSVFLYPDDRSQWTDADAAKAQRVLDMVDAGAEEKNLELVSIAPIDADNAARDYDAYYGSPSPLIPAFVVKRKPVMLANYELEMV